VLLALLPFRLLRRLGRRVDSEDSLTGLLLQRIAQARVMGQFRTDAAAAAVYTAAFLAYGRHAWMLLVALAGRALVASLSDNSYHYSTRLDEPLEAMNLRLPRPLERFVLSFNLHDVHHRHPGLHWYQLRGRFDAEGGRYHRGWFSAVARQLHGPIEAPRGRATVSGVTPAEYG
jgi:fatty acid desaturase